MVDAINRALGATVKYNPHLWCGDELRSIFVARMRELEDIVARIRGTELGRAPQHLLITGARGMGKSTLLHRIALAVADDAELSRQWLPLVLPEEQYTVATLADLWLNVLGVLADTLEGKGASPTELNRLDQDVARIKRLVPAAQEAEALALLLDWVKRDGRRLLLLIDSTDQLFGSLSSGEAKAEQASGSTQLWRLRNALTHSPELFWIGSSYQALEVTQQYHDAFHDFFELIELRPLTLDDMRNAMLAMARTFGMSGLQGEAAAAQMAQNLDARPERLKTLRAITGGNPRTTVILYDLFAASGQNDTHADLKALLDSMTPLYKARMENLAEQPRKIFAHVMEQWEPITLGDLARLSGIPNTTLSGQIKRLEQEGLIEKVKLPGTRRSGYQASERLFNIWYLMRYTSRWVRQKLTWLIEFMRLWYSADELRGMALGRAEAHGRGVLRDGPHLELSIAYAAALPADCRERYQLEHSVYALAHKLAAEQKQALNSIVPGLFDLDGDDRHFKTAEDYLQRFEALDEPLARCPFAQDGERKNAWILAIKQSTRLNLAQKEQIATMAESLKVDQYEELLKILYDEVEAIHDALGKENAERVLTAVVQGNFFPDCPDAGLAYRQIIAEFGDSAHIVGWCSELLRARYQDLWLEKIYRRIIELDPKADWAWNNLGNLLQYYLNRYPEAEDAYRQAIALDPKDAVPWNNLGNLLQNHLNRYPEAEEVYRQAIALDPKDAIPWNNLGNLLKNYLNRYLEAEDAYRQAIALDPKYVRPWNGLGNLLQDHLNRYPEAEEAYRQAIALDPKDASPWNGLGNLLQYCLNRYPEAEEAYRQAIALDPKYAWPWNGLGNLLKDHLNRYPEAEDAYRQAIALDPKGAIPWNGLGNLLQDHLNRYPEADHAYQKAQELEPQDPYPCANRARLAAQLGQTQRANELFRQAAQLAAAQAALNEEGIDCQELLLQAHLWLHNFDAAGLALDRLAEAAGKADKWALYKLREQACEAGAIGLGRALSELMAVSRHADFMQPMILALRAADGEPDALEGAAAEIKNMAAEVLADIRAYRNR
ncbi:tetratricopeptide repeat protein [Methylomicrobium lacus]|uniref:tetratricopeptide repeat protein n=1 Tax=Methylomicrobium lacus TaxID=136992 RepID=UPI0035A852BB